MTTRLNRIGKRIAAPSLTLALVATVGVGSAYAYWTTAGAGSGSATTATNLTGVTVSNITAGTDSTTGQLVPGSTADAIIKVSNSNTFAVAVTSVAQTSGSSISAANGCSPTGVTYTNQTGSYTVPAGSTGTVIHLVGAVNMSTAAASACQGTNFSIPATVTVQK